MDYGTLEVNGVEYKMAGDIDFTGRQLDSRYTNYHEVEDGETYFAELGAHATDPEGKPVKLTWILSFIKGEEPELDSLDFALDYTTADVEYI